MGKKLYVGNLSYAMTNESLGTLFSAHGIVDSAQVIMDRDTNRSKGFGFVEMANAAEADAAMAALDGKENDGRNLKVNEAKPREERSSSSYAGGGNRRY
jgi:RNA recognition motif-containing protein